MGLKKGQILELEIADTAFGGRGLAKVNGLAVFVDQVAPLDHVRVRVVRKRKNYAEARLLEILSPSPYRIDPPCPYSGVCGGCKWQFLNYEKQIEYKQQHVVQSLAHIGGIEDVSVHAVLPSQRIFGYRNKMEFTCSDRRWLMPDEMGREDVDTGFAIGLHVPGTFYKVLDTRACLLQPDLGNAILGDVRDFMKESGLAAYGLRSHIGFWRFLMLRYSTAYDQWMANIITARENKILVRQLADRLTASYPQIASVMNNITARKAGIAVGEFEICMSGTSSIRDKIGSFEFEISANSFFQTNTAGAAQLYRQVKKYAGLTGNQRVVDLYSGTGTIAIWLASEARQVIGIEIVESAVKDARQNCRRNGISNCRFVQGDIIECLPRISFKPDVLIIDPPRAGMHKKVVKLVLEMMPPKIVYVSCNPATMARDVAMMKDVYRIEEVQPVDMFPHTHHIESVARLECKSR